MREEYNGERLRDQALRQWSSDQDVARRGSGSVSSVSFVNVLMEVMRNPIIINQYYYLADVRGACRNQTSAVFVSDVAHKGIKGSNDSRSPTVHFECSDVMPCANITLAEVELLLPHGEIITDPFCSNVYGVSRTLTILPVACLLHGVSRSTMDIESSGCY
ncbi:hypothetical protein ZIOFF_027385 [Zingiber officinale]|uniref:Uncharacterized protein n=1 Tax=Zingiber officinale TaxID=94328 RepID=A0A8J5LD56_ZINOF|nr:hypothetical protein ZIOFF_027385 [Zingiber officinale]